MWDCPKCGCRNIAHDLMFCPACGHERGETKVPAQDPVPVAKTLSVTDSAGGSDSVSVQKTMAEPQK